MNADEAAALRIGYARAARPEVFVRPFVLALALLAACHPTDDTSGDDTDVVDSDTDVGPAALEVGDVADLASNADGSVSIDLANPGDYLVVLVSEDMTPGTLYGYGASAGNPVSKDPGTLRPRPPQNGASKPWAGVQPGDERTFRVYDGSKNVTIAATAVAVTDEVVVWRDDTTENPLGDVSQETIDGVLQKYQDIVMPRERQVFEHESDVDGDGKLAVLLTYTVNEYGPVAYVTWCDIGAGDCASSNDGEIIYMGIPDPSNKYATVDGITETFAHETNHLIYAYHKYVANDQPTATEDVYLTEGMSALAQDLTGFNNGNQYVWGTALDGTSLYDDPDMSIQGVSVADFLYSSDYYDDQRDGPLRGGAYLFLRYLFEQAGGMTVADDGTLTDAGGMAFLHEWFDAKELGPDCVVKTTGRPVEDVVMDWYTALAVTGRVDNANAAWNYEDRVTDPLTGYEFGIDPFDTIHGWWTLTGPLVQSLDEADGQIRAGGVEYLTVTADAGTLSIPVDAAAKARARIIRVQ